MHITPNGKKYIGVTKQKLRARWKNGIGYKHNPLFYKAVLKYGWDNIQHIVLLTNLSKQDAETNEIHLISEHKSNHRDFGYNIENGGNCCGTHSEETKRKIGAKSKGNQICKGRKLSKWHIEQLRKANLGHARYKGCHHSKETKLKMSESAKRYKKTELHRLHIKESRRDTHGINNPMYGKLQSAETKIKISNALKGRKATQEQITAMSERARKRKVIKLDIYGNAICEYESLKVAGEENHVFPQNIGLCCKNNSKTIGGYKWRYVNEQSDHTG
jgi:hypothetical protein